MGNQQGQAKASPQRLPMGVQNERRYSLLRAQVPAQKQNESSGKKVIVNVKSMHKVRQNQDYAKRQFYTGSNIAEVH